MIINHLKIALRSLKKRKGFTVINTVGLALGLATCMLIVFYVVDELGYDRYNTKADRIFRINNLIRFGGNDKAYTSAPAPLAAALEHDYPQVEHAVRLREYGGLTIRKGTQDLQEMRVIFADPSLFDVFSLGMTDGDAAHALVEPHSMVLTESMAKKYFNETQVVGKTILVNDSVPYKITGVIRDMPEQSHFRFDFFLSMSTLEDSRNDAWLSNNFQTYLLLKPGVNAAGFEKELAHVMRRYVGPQLMEAMHVSFEDFEKAGNKYDLSLMNVRDIHLKSDMVGELGRNGSLQYVYIFSVIAMFILLIACVNFMNLSTARSANRAREVGVRKVLGSARRQLIAQFLSESMLVTFIAALIAIILVALVLPLFNHISGKSLAFTVHSFVWIAPAFLITVLVVGVMAGSYPAFFLSGFQPVNVLKGKLSTGFKGGYLRSLLVVFQFSISVFLIIGTLVIYNQLQYIRHKDLGYNRNQLMVVRHLESMGAQADVFKQQVKQLSGVTNATMTGFLPTLDYRNSTSLFQTRGMEQDKAIHSQFWWVDEDYVPTLNVRLLKGRNFSKDMGTDSNSVIINESAARLMNVADPLNKELLIPMDNKLVNVRTCRIIGVIKDFNFSSLRDNITPLTLFYGRDNSALTVRINSLNMPAMVEAVKQQWSRLAPNLQFDYSFMEEDFDAEYRAEDRVGTICLIFTTLAIVIACLGLFGLAAYAAEQRNKEIGIRKVLGADVSSLVMMLSANFIRLVLIAVLVAVPLAWLVMRKWLQSFAYRQNIQWWVLVTAAFAALLIAFITISFQSVKAALTNPVKSLKSE